MRLCVVLLLLGTALATPITPQHDQLSRYQQHSLHRLKRSSFWTFWRNKDTTTTTIPTPTSGADEVREEGSSGGFWSTLNPFRGISNIVKKGYEKMKNSTVGQAIRNSSMGRAFRSGRNATKRGFILIGRKMRSGARSVGLVVRKIKRRLTGEEKYRYFVDQVREGVDRGDKNTLAMLDRLGINVTIDGDGVARTAVKNHTPTATEILESEGFFYHNTSGDSPGDGVNGTLLVTDDSEGSGGPNTGEGLPTTNTTSSPAFLSTKTFVTTRATTSFPNTALPTLSTTTTSPPTTTLPTTSRPITSPPTTTSPTINQPITAPSIYGDRDTNIEEPMKECGQQRCHKSAVTTSTNTTDNIVTGDESEGDKTDTAESYKPAETDEDVFNIILSTEGLSPKLTPTTEHTFLTWAPERNETVSTTAESKDLLASTTSGSPDGAVYIAPLLKHNTDDLEATDSVMTSTTKPTFSVVETSTTESISDPIVAYIPTSSPPSSSTSSPTVTVNLTITPSVLPRTSSMRSTVTPITTPTTSSTTTPSPTTTLVPTRATTSLPITALPTLTTTTSSPRTTTVPINSWPISFPPTTTLATSKPITSPPTTTLPTTSKPTTPSSTTTTPRPTPPPISPSGTDTLAGAGEPDSPGGKDEDFPSPFGPPTDDAGFPSPFSGSGGDDEFPDVFVNRGVRDRLREIYERGDFSHDDLRNAFNFDPNDYHYFYDYDYSN